MLKLQCYNGTDSLETFLHKFNSMSRYLQWNEDDAKYHLCGSLEGAAGQVLEGLSTDAKTTDVIKLLQPRFGTKLQVEQFKAELLARRRQPDETLQHLYREISRLVSLAYPSTDMEFTDHVGKEAFIRALNDGPLQLQVMKGEPTNLESALNYTTKYEAYQCSLVSKGTLSKSSAYISISDDDWPKRRSRAVNAVQDTGKDTAPQLNVGELQDLLVQATKGIAALAAQSGETDKGKSSTRKSSSTKKNSGSRNPGRRGYRRYSSKKQDPKVDPCHNCGEVDHWAKDCPKPKQPAKEQAQVNSISCQLVSPTRICVTAYVEGKPIQCLLDSGCKRNVISRNVVPNVKLTGSRYNLTVADKASLPILGDTTLHFEVDGNRFEANVSVSPAIDDFLLGSDWLEANGVKWDFATGTLHFVDRVMHAYCHTLGKMCRQITVSEDFIVPARHEANMPVKMTDWDIPHPTNNWVIETKQLSSRVMTARTLVDRQQERLVARLCNYSDKPFELKADYCLACAEPVEFIPKRDEESSGKLCVDTFIKMLSVSAGASGRTDLPPTAERDPVTTPAITTADVSMTVANAETVPAPVADATAATETPPSTDNPAADDPYSHIQCLLDQQAACSRCGFYPKLV